MDTVQLKQMEPIFGSWYVDREIGSGSFGKVYSIYKDDAGFRFKAALKVISIPSNQSDIQELDAQGFDHAAKSRYFDNISAGIMEEIRIMNTLRGYTNIVCFEDYQTILHPDGIGRDILIRMELLERLDSYMQRIRATQYDVVAMLRDITQALVLCDKKNIIHRDIKPDNIMVSENGDYKLVDFGIARNMERTSQASTKAGSYPYMAPEVQTHQPYGKSVDIYSLGVVAYRELNAYRYPFLPPYPQPFTAEERDMALYRRFKGEKIPPIPGVNKQLFSIIEKCIAHKPEHRYKDPQDLLNDLNAVISLPELRKKRLFDDAGNMLPPYNGKEFNPKSMVEPSQGRSQKVPTGASASQGGPGQYPPGTGTGSYARSGYYPGPDNVSVAGAPSQASGSSQSSMSSRSGSGSYAGNGTYSQSMSGSMMAPPQKSKGKKFGILIAVFMLLAAAGAVAYLMLRPKDGGQPTVQAIRMEVIRTSDLPEHGDVNTVGALSHEIFRLEGSAEPDTGLVLSYSGNTLPTRSDADGRFSFSIESALLPQNVSTEMTVRYEDSAVSDSKAQVWVTRDGYCAFTIDSNASDNNWITGSTDPWATVSVAETGNTVQADGSGHFTLENRSAGRGSTLQLQATDIYGNVSEPMSYQVPYGPVELTIQCRGQDPSQMINSSVSSIRLFGKGPEEGEISIRVLTDDGQSFYDGTVSMNEGEWEIPEVDLTSLSGEGTLHMTAEWAGNSDQEGQKAETAVAYDRECSLTVAIGTGETLTTDTSTLSGTADPGSQVVLRTTDTKQIAASTTANSQGEYILSGLHLNAGNSLEVIATDPNGNEASYQGLKMVVAQGSQTEETVPADEVRASISLQIPGYSEETCYTENMISISGTAEPDSELEIRIGAQTVSKTRANADGKYSASISLEAYGKNTSEQDLIIRVLYADGAGTASDSATIRYDAGITAPVLQGTVNDSTTVICGTADPGDRVILGEIIDNGLSPNAPMMEGTASGDGTFEINLAQALQADKQYGLFAVDNSGHQSNLVSVTVALATREPLELNVMINGAAVKSGSRISPKNSIVVTLDAGEKEHGVTVRLSGAESGTELVRTLNEENQQIILVANELGSFSDGENVTLTAHYADWDENRDPYRLSMVYDSSTMVPVLTVHDLTPDMNSLEGTAEPGSTVYMTYISRRYSAHTEDDGSFRLEPVSLESGETWTVYAVDTLGNQSEKSEYAVRDIAGILFDAEQAGIVNGYVNGGKDALVFSGTAEPGRNIEITLNGDAAGNGTCGADGNWTASVQTAPMTPDERNTIRFAYSSQPDVLNEVSFIYDPACQDIVTEDPVNEDTETITGRTDAGAKVTLYTQDGASYSTTSEADGTFSIELPAEYRKSGQNITMVAEDPAGNRSNPWYTSIQASERTGIRIKRESLAQYNGIYLVGNGKSHISLSGTGYRNLKLKVTVTDMATGAETWSQEVPCEDDRWEVTAELPDSWDTVRVRAEYSDGLYNDYFADMIDLKYDGECELICETEVLHETSETLRITAEPGTVVKAVYKGTSISAEGPDENNVYTIRLPELEVNRSVKISGKDPAGNHTSRTIPIQLEDRTAPTVGLQDDDGAVNRNDTELRFAGGNAMPGRALTLKVADQTFDGIMPNEDGSWSMTVPVSQLNLKDGTVSYEIGYSDRGAENSGSFIYDSQIIFQLFTREIDEDTALIAGEADPGATIRMYVNGIQTGELDTSEDGSFRFTDIGPFDTNDKLTFTAQDAAGNQAEETALVTAVSRLPVELTTPQLLSGNVVRTGILHLGGTAGYSREIRVTVKCGPTVKALTATSSGGGNWAISQTGITMKDGEEYEITAEYADGKSPASARTVQFTADGRCEDVRIPDRITDSDTSITGTTEKGAGVILRINGNQIAEEKADNQGHFTFKGLIIECDDRIEISAKDIAGNTSPEVTRIADTDKAKLWFDISTPREGSTSEATKWLNTAGTIFSHDPVTTVYYTLKATGSSDSVKVYLTADDLGEETDRSKALAEAGNQGKYGDLLDHYSVRYWYDLYQRKDIGEIDLPNGQYEYELIAVTESGEDHSLTTATVNLSNPDKEETGGLPREYVTKHTNPTFIAGLDELVTDTFPTSGIFFSGWIWAKPETFEDPEVVYYILKSDGQRLGIAYNTEDIKKAGGSSSIVYRNVSEEQPSLSREYGSPNLEQAGFAAWIPMQGDVKLNPGTYRIEVCVHDRKNMSSMGDLKIGIYEITIAQDGRMAQSGESLYTQTISQWDDRIVDEEILP